MTSKPREKDFRVVFVDARGNPVSELVVDWQVKAPLNIKPDKQAEEARWKITRGLDRVRKERETTGMPSKPSRPLASFGCSRQLARLFDKK